MGETETAKTGILEINAGDLFKDLVWSAVIKAATNALTKAIPFLAMGPMPLITGLVVGLVGDFVYDQLKDAYNFQSVSFKNDQHRKEFDSAAIKLKLIARDKGINSDEFKTARQQYGDALAKFIRFAA